jgi:ribonuclease BN (tRNA processing enzyme)
MEYESSRRGWGHSTWQHATRVAADAGVGRLVLTSHDPTRTDEQIADIVKSASAQFPATQAAFEGQSIEF